MNTKIKDISQTIILKNVKKEIKEFKEFKEMDKDKFEKAEIVKKMIREYEYLSNKIVSAEKEKCGLFDLCVSSLLFSDLKKFFSNRIDLLNQAFDNI